MSKYKNCVNLHNNWCEKVYDSPCTNMERECVHFRHMTNADRIRAMSDEELAKIIEHELACPVTGDCEKMSRDCKACWLDWLQMPAEEDDNDHES